MLLTTSSLSLYFAQLLQCGGTGGLGVFLVILELLKDTFYAIFA